MLHCMKPGRAPTCATAFPRKHRPAGARNPFAISLHLVRVRLHLHDRPIADDISRFGVNLPVRDPAGLAKYPVDGPQLSQSRAIIRMYKPEDHFTRTLLIPNTKLVDWESHWHND